MQKQFNMRNTSIKAMFIELGLYSVFESDADFLPQSSSRTLPAYLPKSPYLTRKRCIYVQVFLHELKLVFFHISKPGHQMADGNIQGTGHANMVAPSISVCAVIHKPVSCSRRTRPVPMTMARRSERRSDLGSAGFNFQTESTPSSKVRLFTFYRYFTGSIRTALFNEYRLF